MLKQLIPSLKRLHDHGFAHSDIKLSNICARKGHDGSFKFMLIDLGNSTKLVRLGESYDSKAFRGNLMYASPDHIERKRASHLDDLYSLLCVAFWFMIGSLPWFDYIEELHEKKKSSNFYI